MLSKNPLTEPIFLGSEATDTRTILHYTPSIGYKKMYNGESGHYGYPDFPPLKNIGGILNLETEQVFFDLQGVGTIHRPPNKHLTFNGSITNRIPGNPGSMPTGDGAARGAEAYAKMKPTAPSMRLLTSIYELREIPRQLRQRMSDSPLRDIGSYFLALKFGWEPLLRDIRDLILQQKKIESRIDWLLRNNNKPVRTRITLTDTHDVLSDVYAGPGFGIHYPTLATQFYNIRPDRRTITKKGERWWASARWRIHLPSGPGNIAYRRRLMAELYGLYPTPSTIWKMMPWTWLIDWFSNAGYIIQNLESTMDDRIAADYCYVMRHQWGRTSETSTATYYDINGGPLKVTSTTHKVRELKTRIVGNPFGFSTNMNLSGMQLAILGALGLSRL